MATQTAPAAPPPNIVLIYADDLGYGDLGCYGSKIRTPNIDKLAKEGVLLRQFCSASPVCSPSRASLLTGRYGVRAGVQTVLHPTDTSGLSESETTLAQVLKQAGYQTSCIGKWHLGTEEKYLPTRRGFDEYFGIPYSNDQWPSLLMQNEKVIENPVELMFLTARYTEKAVHFIRRSKGKPFFLYMPHTFPHVPLAASPAFKGKSPMGLYGDTIEEIDWSVGRILQELTDNGLDNNTLVIFSSDNGPWHQGSPGRLRGRKGDTFEGGMRVPFVARFPGRIPEGKTITELATTLDIMPTLAGLAGAPLPKNPLDGVDIWPLLSGTAPTAARQAFLYFDNWNLQCIRAGNWKLHMARYNSPAYVPEPKVGRVNYPLLRPELYDLSVDPAESSDMSAQNPAVVTRLRALADRILPTLPPEVQAAWNETLQRRVHPNVSGAWPVAME